MYSIPVLTSLLVALASGASIPGPKCVDGGVHIIVARESLAAPGPGLIGNVSEAVIKRIEGSDMESVVYPALLEPYITSETTGIANMTKLIETYGTHCPRSKMVLMGYSQGAQVTADILCGASEDGFPTTEPLPRRLADKIVAAVLMGDPSFTAGQPYNVGTGKLTGIFPRKNTTGCKLVADKMWSVCDADDEFCQAGGQSLAVHLAYVAKYGTKAVDFVVNKHHASIC